MLKDNKKLELYQKIVKDVSCFVRIKNNILSINKIVDFKINEKIDVDGNWIGSCIPKQLNLKLIRSDFEINKLDEIELYHQVKKEDGSFSATKLGCFYIDSFTIDEKKQVIEIVAFDKIKQLQDVKIDINYPITIDRLLNLISTKTKTPILKKDVVFSNYTIEHEIYFGKDFSVVDVLRAIVQMNLCFCYINNDNNLCIQRLRDTEFVLNNQNIFNMKLSGAQKAYNSVVISRQPQNDDVFLKEDELVSTTGLSELKIINNPILDLNRENFLPELLEIAKTISYDGAEITMQLNPLIEVGDYIYFNDTKGARHKMAIFEHEMGMSKSVLKCSVMKKTETNYQKAKSLEKRLVEATLEVDKVKGDIQARVAETEKLNEKVEDATAEFAKDVKKIDVQLTDLVKTTETQLKQTKDTFSFEFNSILELVNNLDGKVDKLDIQRWIRFFEGKIELGDSTRHTQLLITSEKQSFIVDGNEVAYFSKDELLITNARILDSLSVGKWKITYHEDGLRLRFG